MDPETGMYHVANTDETFSLPNFSSYDEQFYQHICQDLFDMYIALQFTKMESAFLRWDQELTKLHPVRTSGDGNCLLHAASIAMWGIHDRKLHLRNALYNTLVGRSSGVFFERWKANYKGIELDQDNLSILWSEILCNASADPIPSNPNLPTLRPRWEFLEQIHIFVLAQIVRRPIVVFALNKEGEEISNSERMDGIYLPILCDIDICSKNPLVLVYHSSHFVPLISSSIKISETEQNGVQYHLEENIAKIPIVLPNEDFTPLPVHFLTDSEKENSNELIKNYLSIDYTNAHHIPFAIQLLSPPSPSIETIFTGYLQKLKVSHDSILEKLKEEIITAQPCKTGCGFTGTSKTEGHCSKCFKEKLEKEEKEKKQDVEPVIKPCVSEGCHFFGSEATHWFCSKCFAAVKENSRIMEQFRMQKAPCRNFTCNNPATYEGYCSACYQAWYILNVLNSPGFYL